MIELKEVESFFVCLQNVIMHEDKEDKLAWK